MRRLSLTLRGLRWRAGQSAVLFAVAAASVLCAALGPIWARACESSLLSQRLSEAPILQTSLTQQQSRFVELTPAELYAAMAKAARDPAADRWFGSAYLGARVPNATIRVAGREVAIAGVGWYDQGCQALTFRSGSCPQAPGDVAVPEAAARAGIGVGSSLQVQVADFGSGASFRVVGIYVDPVVSSGTWAGSDPFDGGPSPVGALDRWDTLMVTKAAMDRADNSELRAYSLRPLRSSSVRLSGVGALERFVEGRALQEDRTGTGITSQSKLPVVLSEIADDRAVLRSTTRAITVQLMLLADFVLFLVVVASTEERGREVGLAKLRGMKSLPTAVFGLAEPALLVAFAVPVGVAAALLLDRAVAERVLRPGVEVRLTAEAGVMVGLALAGALVACATAARRALTTTMASDLMGGGARRRARFGSAVLDAAVVAAALAACYEISRGGSDVLALLAPTLVTLALSLLAIRAVPWASRALMERTRRTRRLGLFLAVRQVSRRPEALRIVALLSVATALAAFTLDSTVIAARNRGERAHIETGSDRVVHLAQTTPDLLTAAVAQVDPDGRWAMAALTSGTASNLTGEMVAVDATRLATVSEWKGSWWSGAAAELGSRLRPPSGPAVVIHDGAVVSLAATGLSELAPLHLQIDVRDTRGARHLVDAGVIEEGRHDYQVALPWCRSGCRLAAIHFGNPTPGQSPQGTIELSALVDKVGRVESGLATPGRWRPAAGSRRDSDVPPATAIRATANGLTVTVLGRPSDDPAIEVADHPAAVPALIAPAVDPRRVRGGRPVATALGLDGSSVDLNLLPPASVLPVVADSGTLVDLQTIDRADVGPPTGADYQVWLGPDAPPDALTRLRDAGLTPLMTSSRAARLHQLAHDGISLALTLFLVATLAAVALAVGAVASSVYSGARRREYELAAVRTLGAKKSQLVASARIEQLALLVLGVAIGGTSGLLVARWALPAIPPLGTGVAGIPGTFEPAWVQLGGFLLALLLVCLVVADLLARAVVKGADIERLREGAT